ncbi:uncharacterized membrane protein YgdD (TMEM256/DUF423 family) [Geothermobacter ehrlichii]|uniref:Uncharacterized membrane protein YgdD (TMEM256/DUF423 family) n=1 Tax=Geothermobacter ehrlichii TaxID=213224 RepID=A0A5D3WJH6_9BACT|nr:DUF423 domain-containing protein [Geothermobacter ehrlichii]TYO98447.1 uncharacterized membrane protein YgdD (TMEM256/DUF423 family) [Geothermobacter ehrlichii]
MNDGRLLLLLGALGGFLGVVLGAFGAHGLEGALSEKMLATWNKAVHYQQLHALALLATGLLARQQSAVGEKGWQRAGCAFLLGILLFSGSLYLLVLTEARWLGMVTPFGGLAFLAGWGLLAWQSLRC